MKAPRPNPCAECPWRRVSVAGYSGPLTPDEWVTVAHSDAAIACHLTIPNGFDDDDPIGDERALARMTQCSGAAIYRSNVCKKPRDPKVLTLPADRSSVFGSPAEFRAHHES